jgi:hypothetical protein
MNPITLTTSSGWIYVIRNSDDPLMQLATSIDPHSSHIALDDQRSEVIESEWHHLTRLLNYMGTGEVCLNVEDDRIVQSWSRMESHGTDAIIVGSHKPKATREQYSQLHYQDRRYIQCGEGGAYYLYDSKHKPIYLHQVARIVELVTLPPMWEMYVLVDRRVPQERRRLYYERVGRYILDYGLHEQYSPSYLVSRRILPHWIPYLIESEFCVIRDQYSVPELEDTVKYLELISYGIMRNAVLRAGYDRRRTRPDRYTKSRLQFPLDWCGIMWEDYLGCLQRWHLDSEADHSSIRLHPDKIAILSWLGRDGGVVQLPTSPILSSILLHIHPPNTLDIRLVGYQTCNRRVENMARLSRSKFSEMITRTGVATYNHIPPSVTGCVEEEELKSWWASCWTAAIRRMDEGYPPLDGVRIAEEWSNDSVLSEVYPEMSIAN